MKNASGQLALINLPLIFSYKHHQTLAGPVVMENVPEFLCKYLNKFFKKIF